MLLGRVCCAPARQAILLRIAAGALEHMPQPSVTGAIPGLPASTTNPAVAAAAAAATAGAAAAGAAAGAAEAGGAALSPAEAALHARFPFLADTADRDM